MMKTKIGVLLVLAVLLGACNSATPAPAPEPVGPDYEATVAALETALAENPAVAQVATPGMTLNEVLATPEPTAAVLPPYVPIACGVRPPNGTLIEILKPTTSRACSNVECRNQGTVEVGSVRPLESFDVTEEDGWWLRFSYLPIEGQTHNLLYKEMTGGSTFIWKVEHQWITGQEGDEFRCVEATGN